MSELLNSACLLPLAAPVAATEKWTTTVLGEPVRVRLGASKPMSEVPDPVTVHEMFEGTLRRAANLPALGTQSLPSCYFIPLTFHLAGAQLNDLIV